MARNILHAVTGLPSGDVPFFTQSSSDIERKISIASACIRSMNAITPSRPSPNSRPHPLYLLGRPQAHSANTYRSVAAICRAKSPNVNSPERHVHSTLSSGIARTTRIGLSRNCSKERKKSSRSIGVVPPPAPVFAPPVITITPPVSARLCTFSFRIPRRLSEGGQWVNMGIGRRCEKEKGRFLAPSLQSRKETAAKRSPVLPGQADHGKPD